MNKEIIYYDRNKDNVLLSNNSNSGRHTFNLHVCTIGYKDCVFV